MVEILPFKGLVYNQSKVDDLSRVISPPYDVITPDLDKKLRKLSPYNIINLIVPSGSGTVDKYRQANLIMQEWIKENILKFDPNSCFYLIEESFMLDGVPKSITGFIGLTKIEDYKTQKVLRHENTLPKPKQDRLKLLENTRTNFGLVYTVYRDSSHLIRDISNSFAPDISINPEYDNSLGFKMWRICQPDIIENITGLMAPKSILIADGHHRYETSRIYYRQSIQKGLPAWGQQYILTLFVNSNQKDITVYPTYRLVKMVKATDSGHLARRAKPFFNVSFASLKELDIKKFMSTHRKEKNPAFIIYLGKDKVMTATYKKKLQKNDLWQDLDVNILHNIFLKEVIEPGNIENISFTHSLDQLKHEIDRNVYHMGILLNAPTVDEVETLSRQGFLMPQKSTYFYPKPCTGLVMYKFKN
ncbi:MAG: DUF1015 domain-containing protein [Actinomycetia bacterium]|nr:DUF1015 domain-containing protein [Actinomycetes bacterium]